MYVFYRNLGVFYSYIIVGEVPETANAQIDQLALTDGERRLLHQRGGAALIKITSVLWVDNTFAVSAVVVDNGQITV